jgi:hypothetical protein
MHPFTLPLGRASLARGLALIAALAATDFSTSGADSGAKSTGKSADSSYRWEMATQPVGGGSNVRVAKDFKLELLYTVPRETEGSWVAMCVDPKGRLIVSDQRGALYRVTVGQGPTAGVRVERIGVDIGGAHGLLYAFDSLYVMVNERKSRGLFRVRDTDGDDKFDKVELLREIHGGGEHGMHSMVTSPDGKSIYVVCGNSTDLTEISSSKVPLDWSEDDLLPRLPTGFMDESRAPQGIGSSSRWACEIPSTLPSTRWASCSHTTPTWSGTSANPGTGPRA